MIKPLPFIFVSYRVINNTAICLAVYRLPKHEDNNGISEVFNGIEHVEMQFDYIIYETRPAQPPEYEVIAEQLKQIWVVPKLAKIISVRDIRKEI